MELNKTKLFKKYIKKYNEVFIQLYKDFLPPLIIFFSGTLSASLGIIALVGWHTNTPILFQFQSQLTPMYYNTALCFLILGLGLIAILTPYKRGVTMLGIAVTTLAGLTLIEYIFNVNLGIDEFVFKTSMSLHSSARGRMSPNTAISFVAFGLALILLSFKDTRRINYYIVLFLSMCGLTLGSLSLLGYAAHLPATYQWAKLTPMAVPTAVSFILVSIGTLTYVYNKHSSGEINLSTTMPYVAALFAFCLTLLVCNASLQLSLENVTKLVLLQGSEIQETIKEKIKYTAVSLERLVFQWRLFPNLPEKTGPEFIAFYRRSLPEFKSIEWVDSASHSIAITSFQENKKLLNPSLLNNSFLQNTLNIAKNEREISISNISYSDPQNPEFFIAVPLFEKSDFKGLIIGSVDVKKIFNGVSEQNQTPQFVFSMFEEKTPTQSFFQSAGNPHQDIVFQEKITLYHMHWIVKVWPSLEFFEKQEYPLASKLIFFIGILISFLMFYSLRKGQIAKSKTVLLQEAKQTLEAMLLQSKGHMQELQYLKDLTYALQACTSLKMATRPIAKYCQSLLPSTSGILYLANTKTDTLRPFSHWGPKSFKPQPLPIKGCLAFQQKQPYYLSDDALHNPCGHVKNGVSTDLSSLHLCIPLLDQDGVLGLLQIDDYSPAVRNNKNPFLLPEALAKHLSLSISRLKLRDLLKDQAIRDPLTNLYNRRYLNEVLEREMQKAKRYSRPLSILMIDIDYFKKINDTYGHESGDDVLRTIGVLLLKYYRKSDIACRFGGEEFTLVLPETSLAIATQKAETLRKAVADLHIPSQGIVIEGVSISLGVAAFPQDGRSAKTLISAADRALYKAKRLGRNRVEVTQ
jgi:diguanylate cyclase (GGDEF)-like protein